MVRSTTFVDAIKSVKLAPIESNVYHTVLQLKLYCNRRQFISNENKSRPAAVVAIEMFIGKTESLSRVFVHLKSKWFSCRQLTSIPNIDV